MFNYGGYKSHGTERDSMSTRPLPYAASTEYGHKKSCFSLYHERLDSAFRGSAISPQTLSAATVDEAVCWQLLSSYLLCHVTCKTEATTSYRIQNLETITCVWDIKYNVRISKLFSCPIIWQHVSNSEGNLQTSNIKYIK